MHRLLTPEEEDWDAHSDPPNLCRRCHDEEARWLVYDHPDAKLPPVPSCDKCAEEARRVGLEVREIFVDK